MAKKTEIPKPLLCRRCKKCGEWFIAKHPKDTQELCEKCREREGKTKGVLSNAREER